MRVARAPAPKVGIALAVYRPAVAAFREQLASIRAQTYEHWFCVLTLDSPLAELAEHVPDFLADPRFRWIENETRLGFKGNFTRAARLVVEAGAELVAFADQDDVWYPEKVAVLVEEIGRRPPLSVVHADMDVLSGETVLRESAWQAERRDVDNTDPSRLLVRNVVTGASMLMDAALYARYPTVPDEIRFHDHWYALVASFHGGVYPVHKRFHAYRQHQANVVGVNPYRGFFMGESLGRLWTRRREALDYFRETRGIARRAAAIGLPLTRAQELAFIRRRDAGLGLLGLAALSLPDPPHAAACLALSVGKIMDLVSEGARSAAR